MMMMTTGDDSVGNGVLVADNNADDGDSIDDSSDDETWL